ncbi:MAG: hypothetical protein ABI772_02840 [Bacteroidota bacterium]
MRTINTLDDLRKERIRLQLKSDELQIAIKNDFKELQSWLHPVEKIKQGAEKILFREHNGIFTESMGNLAGFLGRKVIFRNAGFLTKLVVPFLIKNLTTHLVVDNKEKIYSLAIKLLSSFTRKRKEEREHFDEGTASSHFN